MLRIRSIALLAGIAVLTIGCVSSKPDATVAVNSAPVLDPNTKAPASQTLKDFCTKFDSVFTAELKPTDEKISRVSNDLIKGLNKKQDIKAQIAKNHKLFVDGVSTAQQALISLSKSTAHGVDPMEHDKYVAYYTAVANRIGARRDEYQAFLDYEASPSDETRVAILEAASNVVSADDAHKAKKL